ncbi:MAG: InlB B-repeat-containing protein [Faecalibacterium sp.]|nr:InlB B-repeat-containing protein [Faecalibacterium sp.]
MKQGKLIRRAVSAALAGCMMFTLSAPALAESTDALMQLSTGSYRSSSLLSEENSFPTTIKVNGKPVTEANISSILGSENTGKLSYDGVTNTLKSNGRIKGDLTIDAPGVNIELCNSTSGEAAVSGKLTVTNAQDVKVTAQSYVAVLGDVEISCDGKVEITSEESPTVAGDVTVKQASTVAISGESYGYHIVRGDVTIACPATVVIQNHGTGGMASSIVYSGGKYVYSDTVDGTPVDPSGKPIDAKANAVYITPKMYYTINSNDTAVIIKVDDTEAGKARPGQTIKAWAPNKDGWEFENWEATGIDLGKQVNKNWITFKMPESNVTLNPHYAKLHAIEVVNGTADITSAKEGTKVTVTAKERPGYVFDRWVILEGEAELEDEKNKTATVTVKNTNVKVKAVYKELHGISIEGGSFTVNGGTAATAKRGDAIVATADSAPAGQKFSHWEVTGVDGLTEEQLKNVPLEFTMPRGEVTLKAVFKTLHKIDVKFSTADKDTAIEGETVKIMAESRPGYVFDRWEVNNGDVAVAKKNEEETTFVMPDKPVTAVAKYKKLLGITVNSGKAYVEDDVTDAALKGKPVVIKADKIEGKLFDHWKIVSGNVILDDQRASETKFIMPETAVEITAEYNDLHAITVNNGTANVEEAVIGDTVKIKAESREGYVFDRWEVSYGDVAVANKNAEETTFVMPDSMVVLTARYKAMQSITLENGKAYAGGEEITTAKKDTEVAIKADDLDGKVFDHWEIVSGNVTLEDADKAETTFTMPAESISLKAVYNTIHSIHTTFCTADPASAIKGTEITVTAERREGYEFDGWEASDGVKLTEDGKFTMPDHDVTIEAKYKQYHSIEVSKGTATDAEGNPISSAVEGTEIWIEIDREQRNPDEFEFNRWLSAPEDLEIANRKAERTCFTMPDEAVKVEAKFLHLREITVHDGTTYVEGEEGGIAKVGQTVTVKADEIPGLKFDHWTVDSENVTLTTVDEATGEATFEMVNEPVELTAHYKAMVTVFSVPAKFSEDTGEESVTEWADVGEMANITAEIDEATFPGMVFDYWEIVTPADLKAENIESQTIEFKVPKSEVKLVAHWKSDALNPSTDPDASLDPDFDVDPVDDGSGAAGAIVAGAALGGAAIWGGYEIATRVILNDLLPEGAAIPANRGQLALLIWTEKGKPEPAGAPAFADITDAEQAKAAQWCVEQGLLDAREGKFESDGWMPKFKTIEIWNKAFPKK